MNSIVDILFLLLTAVITFSCAKRGFIKSVVHFLKTILSFVFAYLFGGQLGIFLHDKFIAAPIREAVFEKINGLYTSATAGFSAEKVMEELPSFMMTEEIKAKLMAAEGTGEQLVNTMTDSVATPVATALSNVLGYIGVFVISMLALWLVAALVTKLIEHNRSLGVVNRILGIALGLLISLTVLSVAASVLKFFFAGDSLYANSVIVKALGDSALLDYIKFLDVTHLIGT